MCCPSMFLIFKRHLDASCSMKHEKYGCSQESFDLDSKFVFFKAIFSV